MTEMIALVLGIASLVTAIGTLWLIPRRVATMLGQWLGREESPGFPRIPGIPERVHTTEQAVGRIEAAQSKQSEIIEQIHKETKTNGGSSLRDDVVAARNTARRTEEKLDAMTGVVDTITGSVWGLATRLDESEADRLELHKVDAALQANLQKSDDELLEGQKRIVARIDAIPCPMHKEDF